MREDDWLLFYMKLKFKEFPVSVLSILITLYSSSYWGDFRMRSLTYKLTIKKTNLM